MGRAREICAYATRRSRPRAPKIGSAGGLIRASALVAALVVGACWWHDSDVPAIEAADRAATSPLPDGIYCGVDGGASGLDLEDDCVRLAWVAAERRIRASEITATGGNGQSVWLDVAPLSGDLSVLQYDESQEEKASLGDDAAASDVQAVIHGEPHESKSRFTLLAIFPRPDGYIAIPLPQPGVRDGIAAEEGVAVEATSDSSDYGRILAGEPAAVRRVVDRSAAAWLNTPAPSSVDKLAPFDPNAEDSFLPPHYVLRKEAMDPGLAQKAAVEKGVERLREALELAIARTPTRSP